MPTMLAPGVAVGFPLNGYLPIVNAKAFGVDPSGTLDSTTALQNFTNAVVNAAPGTIGFLPAGTYNFSSRIVGPQSTNFVTIKGAGEGATILNCTGTITGNGSWVLSCPGEFSDMTMLCNGAGEISAVSFSGGGPYTATITLTFGDFAQGQTYTITGATGSTAINGSWVAAAGSANGTLKISGVSANTAWVSGGYAQVGLGTGRGAQSAFSFQTVTGTSNNQGTARTVSGIAFAGGGPTYTATITTTAGSFAVGSWYNVYNVGGATQCNGLFQAIAGSGADTLVITVTGNTAYTSGGFAAPAGGGYVTAASNQVTIVVGNGTAAVNGQWLTLTNAGAADGTNTCSYAGFVQNASAVSAGLQTVNLYTTAVGNIATNAGTTVAAPGNTGTSIPQRVTYGTPNPIPYYAFRRIRVDGVQDGNVTQGAFGAWDTTQGSPSQIGQGYYEDLWVTNYQSTTMEAVSVTCVQEIYLDNVTIDLTLSQAAVRCLNFTGHQAAYLHGLTILCGANAPFDTIVFDDGQQAGISYLIECQVVDPYAVAGKCIFQNSYTSCTDCSFGAAGALPLQCNVIGNNQTVTLTHCQIACGIQSMKANGTIILRGGLVGAQSVGSASCWYAAYGSTAGLTTIYATDVTWQPGAGNPILRLSNTTGNPVVFNARGGASNSVSAGLNMSTAAPHLAAIQGLTSWGPGAGAAVGPGTSSLGGTVRDIIGLNAIGPITPVASGTAPNKTSVADAITGVVFTAEAPYGYQAVIATTSVTYAAGDTVIISGISVGATQLNGVWIATAGGADSVTIQGVPSNTAWSAGGNVNLAFPACPCDTDWRYNNSANASTITIGFPNGTTTTVAVLASSDSGFRVPAQCAWCWTAAGAPTTLTGYAS